jgi:Skp family chaperone for outer membrane proteins
VLSVDEDRLFTESRFGKAIIARRDADRNLLIGENRKLDAQLEAEERTLTGQRRSMDKAAFAPLAEAFNAKAESIRNAQIAKSKDLDSRFEAAQQRFYQAAGPVLVQIMAEHGAVAIISKRAILVGFDNIDITLEAIGRLDAVLGDGTAVPDTSGQSPSGVPDAAPSGTAEPPPAP